MLKITDTEGLSEVIQILLQMAVSDIYTELRDQLGHPFDLERDLKTLTQEEQDLYINRRIDEIVTPVTEDLTPVLCNILIPFLQKDLEHKN